MHCTSDHIIILINIIFKNGSITLPGKCILNLYDEIRQQIHKSVASVHNKSCTVNHDASYHHCSSLPQGQLREGGRKNVTVIKGQYEEEVPKSEETTTRVIKSLRTCILCECIK